MLVFGALLVLTVATVAVSYWHLPPGPAILLGLMIATTKAALVAAFFMHLKGERALIYGCLVVTAFFMVILFTIPITDTAIGDFKISAPAGEAPAGPSGH